MIDRLFEMIKNECSILEMRSVLVEATSQEMDKDSMLGMLHNGLSIAQDEKTDDTIRELIDFVEGWCRQDLKIY